MKQVRCIENIRYFTKDRIYQVNWIDADGDIWVQDDDGDEMFMYPDECEEVE